MSDCKHELTQRLQFGVQCLGCYRYWPDGATGPTWPRKVVRK